LPSDGLADDAAASECLLLLLFLLAQLSTTGLLLRGLAVTVPFLSALIAFLGYTLYLFCYGELAPLEQFAIVLPSLAARDTDELARLVGDDELGWLSVAPLCSAGVAPLFF
jgi:hypothetical protein